MAGSKMKPKIQEKPNLGFQGHALGRILAEYLWPDDTRHIIIHHITARKDEVQLEIEYRDPNHTNPIFERRIMKV